MNLDQDIQSRIDAYRGNPGMLMQRYQQSQQLVDLLALQKIKQEKEAAARDIQMQMAQKQAASGQAPMTIAQQREKEVLDLTRNDLIGQQSKLLQQQQGEQQAAMQKLLSGIASAPGAQSAAAPQAMATGGIVAFEEGGSTGSAAPYNYTPEEFNRLPKEQQEKILRQIRTEKLAEAAKFQPQPGAELGSFDRPAPPTNRAPTMRGPTPPLPEGVSFEKAFPEAASNVGKAGILSRLLSIGVPGALAVGGAGAAGYGLGRLFANLTGSDEKLSRGWGLDEEAVKALAPTDYRPYRDEGLGGRRVPPPKKEEEKKPLAGSPPVVRDVRPAGPPAGPAATPVASAATTAAAPNPLADALGEGILQNLKRKPSEEQSAEMMRAMGILGMSPEEKAATARNRAALAAMYSQQEAARRERMPYEALASMASSSTGLGALASAGRSVMAAQGAEENRRLAQMRELQKLEEGDFAAERGIRGEAYKAGQTAAGKAEEAGRTAMSAGASVYHTIQSSADNAKKLAQEKGDNEAMRALERMKIQSQNDLRNAQLSGDRQKSLAALIGDAQVKVMQATLKIDMQADKDIKDIQTLGGPDMKMRLDQIEARRLRAKNEVIAQVTRDTDLFRAQLLAEMSSGRQVAGSPTEGMKVLNVKPK